MRSQALIQLLDALSTRHFRNKSTLYSYFIQSRVVSMLSEQCVLCEYSVRVCSKHTAGPISISSSRYGHADFCKTRLCSFPNASWSRRRAEETRVVLRIRSSIAVLKSPSQSEVIAPDCIHSVEAKASTSKMKNLMLNRMPVSETAILAGSATSASRLPLRFLLHIARPLAV